jgi:hypothetical protein
MLIAADGALYAMPWVLFLLGGDKWVSGKVLVHTVISCNG